MPRSGHGGKAKWHREIKGDKSPIWAAPEEGTGGPRGLQRSKAAVMYISPALDIDTLVLAGYRLAPGLSDDDEKP